QYMANVAMKVNLKGAGINHTTQGVANWMGDTLVLGADVTHPGSSALAGSPSITAMVGSMEASGGRFTGNMQMQQAKTEINFDVQTLVLPLLRRWCQLHNKWPSNVLYYRDGVSISQYDDIVQKELPGIRKAFTELAKQAKRSVPDFKLTAVIVTKRHSTRFFPTKEQDAMASNQNTRPGTLVDGVVTHPYYTDFYLQSHNAIKGTARPAHYFVLRNEMAITTEELEDLTHQLCHTYVRATLGVSYASPAYYADRLCERGRCYLRPFYN
ncbi:stem cell self-renewal protein Piwi, partial [Setomelanomma holmii]